uniref:Uncharacterized protein n=1 Tax=Zea mays TaxID=4577 RepID=A0A804QN06_MAIZE
MSMRHKAGDECRGVSATVTATVFRRPRRPTRPRRSRGPFAHKIGRYSAEERREKIERYRTKRNFDKKSRRSITEDAGGQQAQGAGPLREEWRDGGRAGFLQATRGRPSAAATSTATATAATSSPPPPPPAAAAATPNAGEVASKPQQHLTTASGGGKRRWPLQLRSGILRAAQRWTDADRVPVPQITVHAEAVAWRRRLPLVPAGRLSFCCWLGRRHQRIGSKTAGETPAQQPSGLARACGRGLVGVGLVDLETRGGPDVPRRIAK